MVQADADGNEESNFTSLVTRHLRASLAQDTSAEPRTYEQSCCTLLLMAAKIWVRDALCTDGHRSDKLDKWRVRQTHDQALRDFSASVEDPTNNGLIVALAKMGRMEERTILNVLLDAAHLPRNYQYEMEQAA